MGQLFCSVLPTWGSALAREGSVVACFVPSRQQTMISGIRSFQA